MKNRQLPLDIYLNDDATFTDFTWAGNALLLEALQNSLAEVGERFLFLWGSRGCGKSHLLQAACTALGSAYSGIYLPLNILKTWAPDAIEGMEQHHLIAIDDIEAIAANKAWEEQIFHLYNRIRDENNILIVSADTPPAQLKLDLPDLKSRLCSGLTLHVQELTDDDKVQVLIQRAHQRGFVLPSGVAQFLVNRNTRNMHDLIEILNRLDEASLAAHRKITIPFVKEILGL